MYTRGDRRRDSRLVYTLQATSRRDDRSDSGGDDRPVYTPYYDNIIIIVR